MSVGWMVEIRRGGDIYCGESLSLSLSLPLVSLSHSRSLPLSVISGEEGGGDLRRVVEEFLGVVVVAGGELWFC